MGVKNRLKEIRMREYMMSAIEFCKLFNVSVAVYSSWENDTSRPKLEKALEVSQKLNRRVDDIWYLE
jgi:putative transcriptional regulator